MGALAVHLDQPLPAAERADDQAGRWLRLERRGGVPLRLQPLHAPGPHPQQDVRRDLGGARWAAAALLMGFFFVQSGATTADDKPAYVFAYLPNSVRRRYIREAQGDAAPRSAPMKA